MIGRKWKELSNADKAEWNLRAKAKAAVEHAQQEVAAPHALPTQSGAETGQHSSVMQEGEESDDCEIAC